MNQPKYNPTQHHMYEVCKNHMHSYVLLEVTDGSVIDGIIIDVDENNVHLAIPNVSGMETNERFVPYGGYPYGPVPPYGYYPYPYGGPVRFRRLVLPLAALTALSVLPWI
ncbi:hypothetical protein GCM10011351_08360 [Paraliobacillus quinghaiensis]|uniref:Uncharacterized protein n=1 Tax=Paraliobacillus quinghaiensis TaxID=470815 RepID=A0A917WSE2_9BACI|nr:hypothetical protein [Paraliobacillus quinghaiensis]GGM24993.1 hypothetical protein GCM10011351_08360 [Paraliobacillus quinghaiensis]